MSGKVYLVGAGPGDPELLTRKALRLLQGAQAVLHDDLVSSEILKLIPKTALMHSVGKRCGTKKIMQQGINFLMVELANAGLDVIRLKGGDPLLFGRAGEEIESLRRANIDYEIVPGVTSAFAAAASAGIPLTHRHASSAIVFLTAHLAPEKDGSDWSKYVDGGATLAIYMPGRDYSVVVERLTRAGLVADTPCAVVSRATTAQEQIHRTTIQDLPRAPQLPAPTLLIVGEVVRLANVAEEVSRPTTLPILSAGSDRIFPMELFRTFLSQAESLGTDEESFA
jgi:uroporphyrin-III C-methyltransferase